MEKMNNNIPTPEELKAYIDESVISVTGTYEQSASVLMVDDSVIGTLGNFSASIGKAKSKKTFNVSAITAAALINGTVLHYRACFPEDKRKILYIDTEQGKNHCQIVLNRILRLAGLPKGSDADNLKMLALRKQFEDAGTPKIFARSKNGNNRTGNRHDTRLGTGYHRWHP